MSDRSTKDLGACPHCGSSENEAYASFCQACGRKLITKLTSPEAPSTTRPLPSTVAGKYVLNALLWTAPTYNAYRAASLSDSTEANFTIIERSQALGDPLNALLEMGDGSSAGGEAPALAEVAAALEKFNIVKPIDWISEQSAWFVVYEAGLGQPLAHIDQTTEKETRVLGLQLCELAEQFHKNGWAYNGFEPYSVIIGPDVKIRLLGFDRARQIGSSVANSPIYASKGYTAPELFDPDAVYGDQADVYSIGALLQFLLTGERLDAVEGTTLFPVATVVPSFERLVGHALYEDPVDRFESTGELTEALKDLTLPVVLQSGQFTDVGLVRELNEDSVLALQLTQYFESVQTQIGLYVISDGMGGEAAGEVASRVTVRAIAEWVTDKLISASLKSTRKEKIAQPTHTGGLKLAVADGNDMATTELLKQAIQTGNREVMAYAKANPHERGLGATVTAALVVGEVLTVAHVGDSRCYLLSGDHLEQMTEDHSLVQRMINTGNLSRSEARIHPYRNVIYRSIGADENIEIDVVRRRLSPGDVVMLCSDGLNGMISDDQIRDILMVNPDPTAAAKELVVTANAAGGEDNTSVVVVRID